MGSCACNAGNEANIWNAKTIRNRVKDRVKANFFLL